MQDEHDGDRTSPDLGTDDDRTNPGQGTANALDLIAGALNRAVVAVKEGAGIVQGLGGDARWSALRSLGNLAHRLGEAGHDLGRICHAQAYEEETKARKGIP